MVEFQYEELVKATNNFDPTRLIGKGSHGFVYKGIILEDNKFVAIKKTSQALQSLHDNSRKLENEARVLSSLRENPHVLSLMGTSHDSFENKVLVMELMPNGSLHDWLHGAKTPPPSWTKRVEIAMQIARALQFLHEGKPLVIHRDVKSANVLFDSNWNAKLADFGLAVLPVDSVSQATLPAGTMGYIDPCYTMPSKLSTKNDIFSFGVLLLEIMSGRKAMDVHKSPASIVEWAAPLIEEQMIKEICDAKLALPAYMVNTIVQFVRVAARCVLPNEEDRPSIGEVIVGMENCFIERVRFRIWTSILKMRLRKQRKLRKSKCAAQEHEVDHSHLSTGKNLSLREVLADVTLN